ncbi:hypothetical protein AB0B51_33045 [Streptomyces griseus]|uniref:hypothetical protein n=1 Tax=Streptomyces griseus TaxID=1911 RepID=UPI0004C5EF69|nr:hypothetical protein [Streptomyces griseus]
MTTTARRSRPLAPHGTYSRANGQHGIRPPCHCEPCRTTRSRVKKQQRLNRHRGIRPLVDAAPTAKRLHELHESSGWEDIARAAKTSASHLREIASGRLTQISPKTQAKIMAIRPAVTGGQYIDSTGTVRRVRALIALGYTLIDIAESANVAVARVQTLAAGYPSLRRTVAERITNAYQELSETSGNNTRAKNRARTNGWAPPATWDDDTIDDPQGHPEWTGYCGTDRGWWTHRQQNIPVCDACDQAHIQWKRDHQHLPRTELMASLNASRASASQRGEAIAHDGRELLAQGHTPEQAAARLGISTDYLHQELRRHPLDERQEMAA